MSEAEQRVLLQKAIVLYVESKRTEKDLKALVDALDQTIIANARL